MGDSSLQEKYKSKLRTADEAVRMIRSGQRVFIGSSCGEPQHLVNALLDNARYFSDVEIVRLLSLEGSLLSLMADEFKGHTEHFHEKAVNLKAGVHELLVIDEDGMETIRKFEVILNTDKL